MAPSMATATDGIHCTAKLILSSVVTAYHKHGFKGQQFLESEVLNPGVSRVGSLVPDKWLCGGESDLGVSLWLSHE